jgi:hypothetical protein
LAAALDVTRRLDREGRLAPSDGDFRATIEGRLKAVGG